MSHLSWGVGVGVSPAIYRTYSFFLSYHVTLHFEIQRLPNSPVAEYTTLFISDDDNKVDIRVCIL